VSPLAVRLEADVTAPSSTLRRSWLSYFRFSLRRLIGLIVVIGLALGWIVHVAREAAVQRSAVAAVTRSGGVAMYEWEWRHNQYIGRGAPSWPSWLVDLFGIDYFGGVRMASLGGSATDDDLSLVGKLAELEGVIIASPEVTDTGIQHLAKLDRLQAVVLWQGDVSAAGLAHLKDLRGLTRLKLGPMKVTEPGMAQVGALRGLRLLEFDHTDVAEAGLAELSGLANLQQLLLEGPKFTDGCLEHVVKPPHLARLYVEGTSISEASKAELKRLPKLEIHCDEGASQKTWFKSR
jgi:hypothetical protein